jgi:hypothetical protein
VTHLSPFEVWTEIEGAHEFEVMPAHIALLRRANTGWEGHGWVGAPSLLRKRPFGNSDVYADMAQIVDGRDYISDHEVLEEEEVRYDQLLGELALVLEIVLQSGSFEPGHYTRPLAGPWQRRPDPSGGQP